MFGFVKKLITFICLMCFPLTVFAGRGIPMIPDPDNSGYVKPAADYGISAPSAVIGGSLLVPNKATIVLIGDSVTAECDLLSSSTTYYRTGYWTWTRAFMGERFDTLGIEGVGGDTLAQMAARIDDVLAYSPRPKYCLIAGGANDMTPTSLEDMQTAVTTMLTSLKAAGIKPIVLSPFLTEDCDTASEITKYYDYTRWLRFNAEAGDYYYIDVAPCYINPDASGPWAISSYLTGPVHLDLSGYLVVGRYLADELSKIETFSMDYRPHSGIDENALSSNNILAGSGGTNSTGSSGDVADSFTAQTYGGAAVVCSKSTRNDWPGYWQEMEITWAAASSSVFFKQTIESVSADIGASVRIVFDLKTTDPTGLYGVQAFAVFKDSEDATISMYKSPTDQSSYGQGAWIAGETITFVSEPYTIPGNTDWINLQISLRGQDSETSSIKIGSLSLVYDE